MAKQTKIDLEQAIVWNNQPPPRGGRRPNTNILNQTSGQVVGHARDATTELEVFSLFFSEEMINIVVTNTNTRIANHNQRNKDQVELLDNVEFRALLGLFYFRAFFHWNYDDRKRLWNLARSHPAFSVTMSLRRFSQILKFLAFDDSSTRKQRQAYDNFAAMRELFEVRLHRSESEMKIESFTQHYGEFAISSLPQNFFKKMHQRASKFFQLIFAQTCKISFQEVFFLLSRPVPPLWGTPGLISGNKLFLRE